MVKDVTVDTTLHAITTAVVSCTSRVPRCCCSRRRSVILLAIFSPKKAHLLCRQSLQTLVTAAVSKRSTRRHYSTYGSDHSKLDGSPFPNWSSNTDQSRSIQHSTRNHRTYSQ
eukprot:3376123-Ditylum_brightwellii.AAC.1